MAPAPPHISAHSMDWCSRASCSAVARPTSRHRHRKLWRCRDGRWGGRRGTCVTRGEVGLVVGRADFEGDLGFGADKGAAGIIRCGAGSN